jgi:cell division protein ZipA
MMQANWSLILNALLLIGVIAAIGRLMKGRKQSLRPERYQSNSETAEKKQFFEGSGYHDDIIAVRKVNPELISDASLQKPVANQTQPRLLPDEESAVLLKSNNKDASKAHLNFKGEEQTAKEPETTIMMFLLAKENRQFAGYELLQTVLATGLRFGKGSLFHRHQFANGDGAIVCSLAAATATGIFDLQNIGAFSVRGLCLYMQATHNPDVDAERFALMLDTAKQLSEGLDAYLLDDQRHPLTEERIARYHQMLHLNSAHFEAI